MLTNLARWCFRHRRATVGFWIVALLGATGLATAVGGDWSNDFSLPGTESQAAHDLLTDRFPAQSGDTATAVFATDGDIEAFAPRIGAALAELGSFPHVGTVDAPGTVSGDGTTLFATVTFDVTGDEVPVDQIEEMSEVVAATVGNGLRAEFGGAVVAYAEFEEPGGQEMIGFLAAIVILLLAFGSVLAMGLPLLGALFGLGVSLALVVLSARVLSVPDFTPQLASMIGLGVGIDYSLFIVTRYRALLMAGHDTETATVGAIATSGRAVLVAGTTVVISFLGILLMGFEFVEGVAVGGAAAVLAAMAIAVTLVPALCGFIGQHVDRWHIPRLLHRHAEGPEASLWFRWSRVVQRRPGPIALAGLAVLVGLSLPVFSMRLGAADAGTGDESRATRRAYDMLTDAFGPGFNAPLLVAAEFPGAGTADDLDALRSDVAGRPGVAAVSEASLSPAGDAAVFTVFPTTSPQDTATNDLVHRLRDEVVPEAMAGTGIRVRIGGLTAGTLDFADQIGDRLPWLIGVVLAASFLLLVAVFRSLVVPAKAVVMNLLSIGAAYGVIVAIFQWGWLAGALGVESAPIEAWAPMMLFAILFGLSMDYEIFLLSAVREDYLRTGDNSLAVANGLAATARVITAAAAIMVTVFAAFVFGMDERAIKLFGFGLAVAILVDATIVRMVLVPATMELLGKANWWLPAWVARRLPSLHVEGAVPATGLEVLDLRDRPAEPTAPEPRPAVAPASGRPGGGDGNSSPSVQ